LAQIVNTSNHKIFKLLINAKRVSFLELTLKFANIFQLFCTSRAVTHILSTGSTREH